MKPHIASTASKPKFNDNEAMLLTPSNVLEMAQ